MAAMPQRPEFSVEVRETATAIVVAPTGELDMATVPRLRAALDSVSRDATRLVLDLRELEFIDTSGMRLILELNERARRDGLDLALVPGHDAVQRLFEIAGVAGELPFGDAPAD